MASKKLPSKAPGDVVDYPIDFSLLLATAEVISSVVSIDVETGLTNETPSPPIDGTGKIVTPVFSGGTEGETYRIVLLVETDQGSPARRFERSFYLTVEPLS